jgi:hypothetical protein
MAYSVFHVTYKISETSILVSKPKSILNAAIRAYICCINSHYLRSSSFLRLNYFGTIISFDV